MLFLRDQLEAAKKWVQSNGAGNDDPNNTLMEQMVADQEIDYQGESYQRARRFFKANLIDIINTAKQQGVRVILSNLVSNVRDLPPFVSMYASGTDRSAFERAINRAENLTAGGHFAAALAIYDSLGQADESPAIAHYKKGKCLEAMGNFDEARLAYEKARDLDGLRFRASGDFNAALQEVVQETGAALVDMESAFVRASPNGLIGKNLLLEHVHPNIEGYFIMGRELCRAMRENDFVTNHWDEARARPDSVYWKERGVTALDEEIARIRIQVLMHNWPFVSKASAVPFVYQPRNDFEKLAYAAWKREESWEKVHVLLAEAYEQRGQLALAAKEYEALILQTPYNVSPYIRAGLIYTQLQAYERARDRLVKSIALEPTADAHKIIGAIWLNRRLPEKAVPYLQKALQLEPGHGQTLFNLTSAYLQLGQIENARASLAQLERLMPGSDKVEKLRKNLADAQNTKKATKS